MSLISAVVVYICFASYSTSYGLSNELNRFESFRCRALIQYTRKIFEPDARCNSIKSKSSEKSLNNICYFDINYHPQILSNRG
jgi:hypothetical protein